MRVKKIYASLVSSGRCNVFQIRMSSVSPQGQLVFSQHKRSLVVPGLVAFLLLALVTGSEAITYRGEELRSPCKDLLLGKAAPGYQVVDLHNRRASMVADLGELKHSQMVLLSDRDLADPKTRTALQTSQALLCLKMEEGSAAVLGKNLHRKNPVLFAIPNDSAGINNLYPVDPNPNGLEPIIKQMNRVVTQLEPIKDRITFLSDSRSERKQRDQVIEAFGSASDYTVVTLVCHNDGGTIKFPDGSKVTLSEISELAKAKEIVPLILSCNTIDHIGPNFDGLVSTKALYFEDIAAGLVEADTLFKKGGFECCYLGDFLYALDTGMKEKGRKSERLGITIKSIGSVTVVVALAVIFDDDKKGEERKERK
jgi:hypothetical protein